MTPVLVLLVILTSLPAPTWEIVGGSNGPSGQFPYQVAVEEKSQHVWTIACGGIILSPTWILTQATCIQDFNKHGMRVVAGVVNLDSLDQAQIIQVDSWRIHEGYRKNFGLYDVGLLKLKKALVFNTLVAAVKLPKENSEVSTGNYTISGWGIKDDDHHSTLIQYAKVPLISYEECKICIVKISNHYKFPIALDRRLNICTGPLTGGIGVCALDSGDPLTSSNGTLLGMVSYILGPCGGKNVPSVYSKVSQYIEFIEEHVDDFLDGHKPKLVWAPPRDEVITHSEYVDF